MSVAKDSDAPERSFNFRQPTQVAHGLAMNVDHNPWLLSASAHDKFIHRASTSPQTACLRRRDLRFPDNYLVAILNPVQSSTTLSLDQSISAIYRTVVQSQFFQAIDAKMINQFQKLVRRVLSCGNWKVIQVDAHVVAY